MHVHVTGWGMGGHRNRSCMHTHTRASMNDCKCACACACVGECKCKYTHTRIPGYGEAVSEEEEGRVLFDAPGGGEAGGGVRVDGCERYAPFGGGRSRGRSDLDEMSDGWGARRINRTKMYGERSIYGMNCAK